MCSSPHLDKSPLPWLCLSPKPLSILTPSTHRQMSLSGISPPSSPSQSPASCHTFLLHRKTFKLSHLMEPNGKIMELNTTLPKLSNSLLTPKRQLSLKLGIQGPSGLALSPLISHPSYTLQHPLPSIPGSIPAHSPQTYLSLISAPLPYFLPSNSLSLGFSIYKGTYLDKLTPEFPSFWF